MQSQAELVNALMAALAQDDEIDLDAYPIHITFQDSLRLEGEVANIIVKRKAPRIVMQVSGLTGIEDHLHLRPDGDLRDESLQDTTVDALAQEPAFRDIRVYAGHGPQSESGQWISISTLGCVVRLNGQVGSLSHRRLAEVICWWVPGSCDVQNRMRVQPAEQDNDDEISDALRLVLEKDPLLHAETISAITHRKVVTLEGYVHDPEQRRMAVYDCWYVPGVHDVKDCLRLIQ